MKIIAHRGSSEDAPENTLAAIHQAWLDQADGVEVDLRMTADRRIVLLHDENALRTTGVDLNVAESAWDVLRPLDAGGWKGPRWKHQRIPLFRDLLKVAPSHRVILAELKCGVEAIEALQREMKGFVPHPEAIVFLGFSLELLEAVRRELRDFKVLLNVEAPAEAPPGGVYPSRALIDAARRAHLHGLSLGYSDALSAASVSAARKEGLEIAVWSVNEEGPARRMAEMGVDYLLTDRPAFIRKRLGLVLPP